MYLRNVTLALAIAAAFALPARAQQGSPAQNQFPEPAIPWGYVPSLADVQKAKAAENPSVRAVAQDVYGQLVSGKLNRSKLTQDVNAAFTDTAESTLAKRLSSLRTPAWTFVRNAQTSAGSVSVYDLKYQAGSLYLTIGVDDNGVVYALGLTSEPPVS